MCINCCRYTVFLHQYPFCILYGIIMYHSIIFYPSLSSFRLVKLLLCFGLFRAVSGCTMAQCWNRQAVPCSSCNTWPRPSSLKQHDGDSSNDWGLEFDEQHTHIKSLLYPACKQNFRCPHTYLTDVHVYEGSAVCILDSEMWTCKIHSLPQDPQSTQGCYISFDRN